MNILLVMLILSSVAAFIYIRNNVVYRNYDKIINAIHDYGIHLLDEKYDWKVVEEVCNLYDKMESYDQTMIRFWDFGYTRILPKDEFEKIKDFIK